LVRRQKIIKVELKFRFLLLEIIWMWNLQKSLPT